MRLVTKLWWRQSGIARLGRPRASPAHDQPPGSERRLRDLRLAHVGIVLHGDPGGLGDLLDQPTDRVALLDTDRELNALPVKRFELLVVLKAAVGADHDPAGVPSTTDAREQLLDEADGAALRVCFAFAVADVQHLAGVRASREDRVVAELTGVAVGRALLLVTVDLADEVVDVDTNAAHPAPASDARPSARSRTRSS